MEKNLQHKEDFDEGGDAVCSFIEGGARRRSCDYAMPSMGREAALSMLSDDENRTARSEGCYDTSSFEIDTLSGRQVVICDIQRKKEGAKAFILPQDITLCTHPPDRLSRDTLGLAKQEYQSSTPLRRIPATYLVQRDGVLE